MIKANTVKKALAAILVMMLALCGCNPGESVSSGLEGASSTVSAQEGMEESSTDNSAEGTGSTAVASTSVQKPTASQTVEPSGGAYDKALEELISSAGGKNIIIFFEPGNYELKENHTIPANITIGMVKGAYFTVAAGKTLTIKGAVQADPHHIFRGAGKIAGSIQGDSYVQWFGTDSITGDQSAAIQNAINACEVVVLPSRVAGYTISHIEISKPTVFRGVGGSQALIRPTGSQEKLIEICSSNVTVRDLNISGSEGAVTSKAAIYINTAKGSYENILLDNLSIVQYGYGVRDAGSSGTIKNLDMRNILVDANCNTGVWLTDATTGIDLRDVAMNSFAGPICKGFVFENIKEMYLENCDVNGGGAKTGGTSGDGMTFNNCQNVTAYRIMIDYTTGKLLIIKNSKKFHFSGVVTSLQAYGEGFYLENVTDSVFDVCKANGDIYDTTGYAVLYMKNCNNNTFNNFIAERSKGPSIQLYNCNNNTLSNIGINSGAGAALQIFSGSGNVVNGLVCKGNAAGILLNGTNNVVNNYISDRVGTKAKVTSSYAD